MNARCKVVLVDDHQLFVDGLSSILQGANPLISVSSFTHAEEALAAFKRNVDVDLILLDLHMPNMDGLAFLSAVKKLDYVPAVLIVSSDIDIRVIYQSLAQGAAGFVPKSVDSKTMLQAIEQTLQTGTYIPKNLEAPLNTFRETYESLMSCLSEKQQQVLLFMSEGLTNAQIAEKLFLSRHAVKYHLSHIFELLGVSNRADCINKAKSLGLLGVSLVS